MSVIKKVIECGMEYEYILPYGNHVSFEMKDNTTIIVEYCGDSPDHTVCCWHEIERILFSHPFAECFAKWLVENKAKVTKCRLSGNETLTIGDDYITTNGMSIEFAAQQMCIKNWYLTTLATTPDNEREAFLASLVVGK